MVANPSRFPFSIDVNMPAHRTNRGRGWGVRGIRKWAAPVLFFGTTLGAWQGLCAWYLHHALLSGALVSLGIIGFGVVSGVVWLLLMWPYMFVRSRGFLARPHENDGIIAACAEIALTTATWKPALELLAPLVEDGVMAGSVALGLALLACWAAFMLSRRLPLPEHGAVRRGAWVGLLLLVSGAGFMVYSGGFALFNFTNATEPKPGRPAPPGSPDVLLITVDALRADYLGAYSKSVESTPNIDSLAH